MDRNNDKSKKTQPDVALRKESVDRNIRRCLMSVVFLLSLSARRAWIEIELVRLLALFLMVALRKESVDRNFACSGHICFSRRRSPQGERG